MADDREADLPFPLGGVDRSTEYQLQPPLTTPVGNNVRACEPAADRARGSSRAGLRKYLDQRVGGLDSVIQHLNIIVDPTSPAVLGSFPNPSGVAGGDPDSADPGIPDPSTNNLFDTTGDPLDRRVPPGGRTVPTGGGGGPPVRNKPSEEVVGDKHLYLNSYLPSGTEFEGIADDIVAGLVAELAEWDTFTDEYPAFGYSNANGGSVYQGLPIDSAANGGTASVSSSSGSSNTSTAHRDATYGVGASLAKRLKVVMARGFGSGYEGLLGTYTSLGEQNVGSFRTHTFGGGTTGDTFQLESGGIFITSSLGYLAAEATDLATGYAAAETQTQTDEFHVLWVVWYEYDLVENEVSVRFPSSQPEVIAALISDRITVVRFRGTLGDGGIDASYDAIYDYVTNWIVARL